MGKLSMKVCKLDKTPICELLDNTQYKARNILENFAINEITTLSFDLPVVYNGKWANLSNETLIYFNEEYYNIKTVQFTHSQDNKLLLHVEAKHLSEILASQLISVEETTPRNIEDLLKIALMYDENGVSQTGWTIGDIKVDRVKLRGLEANEQSPFSIILTIVEKWDAIAIFDSKTMKVNVIPSKNTDHPSLDLRVSKNLKEVNITYDTSEICTRLYGYGGQDDDGNDLDIMSVNPTGLPYVDNFDYFISKGYTLEYIEQNPQMFVRTNIYREESIYDPQDLYDNTVAELEKVSQPKVDVTIQALNTTKIKANNIVNVGLGDCVLVHDEDLGMSFVCNVISKEVDHENPHLLNVELVNSIQYRDIIAELFNSVNNVSSIVHSGNITGATTMEDVQNYLNLYYLNTDELEAKYATIENLETNYLTSEQIKAQYIDADSIASKYATITQLNAVEAQIKDLDVDSINAKLGEFDELFADNAEFHELIADEAEIKELQTGDLTVVGTLKANKAELEEAIAVKLSVGDFNAYKATIENLLATKASIEELEANYIKATEIESTYAKITELDAVVADVETLNVDLAKIEDLVVKKADIEDLNATNAQIETLNTSLTNVNTLLAKKADIEYVDAEIVEATKVLADDISAINAAINTLDAKYATIEALNVAKANLETLIAQKATIEELNAAKADIGTLEGLVANINSIMAGNVGTGTLQTIHLTAKNVVIDDAVIKSAMIESIDTDVVTVGNENIILSGSTQQFKDKDGNVRVQIGQDAQGEFTFIICDENGATIISGSGVTEKAIPDGLIKDKMVADDANIQGKKLDIDSVITEINDNGTTTINSSKIWIDEENQSLGAKFDSITTNVQTAVTQSSTAISTANQAKTTAESANATASTANTNASNALTKAGDADTKADSAIQDSATAKSNASTALNTANTANTNATNALDKANENAENIETLTETVSTKVSQTDFEVEQGRINSLISETETIQTTVTQVKSTAETAKSTADTANSTANSAKTTAQNAQTTANSKAKVFIATPTPPYNVGDLWVQGSSGDIMECKTARASGSYTASDWVKASKYTDDTKANEVQSSLTTLTNKYNQTAQTVEGNTTTIGNIQTTVNDLTGEVEDMDSRITEVKTTADGVQTTVSNNKATWDGAATTANSAMSQATQNADKISWMVKSGTSATDFTLTDRTATLVADNINLNGLVTFSGLSSDVNEQLEKVDNIKIGSTNLLLNSAFTENFNKWNVTGDAEITEIDGVKCTHITGEMGVNKNISQNIFDKINTDKLHQTYVCSADVRLDNFVSGTTNPFVKLYFSSHYDNNGVSTFMDATLVSGESNIVTYREQGWVRMTYVLKFDKIPTDLVVYVYARDFTGDLYFKNLKLEKGNIATEWTPAPEDKANQSLIDAWVSDAIVEGTTTINGGYIKSNTIDTDHLVVDKIFSTGSAVMNIIDARELNADMITSGTIKSNYIELYGLEVKHQTSGITTFAIDNNGEVTIRGGVESYNYTSGSSGWSINSDGNAEFNDVIIRGDLINTDGGISSEVDDSATVRFWAGATYEERESAPWIVYSDGSMVATKGTFGGVFTGEIEIGNISIIDPSKTSGNDAIVTIQHGGNGVKRVQLRDTESSDFAQVIKVTDNAYNQVISLGQDGYGLFSGGITVGNSTKSSVLSNDTLILNGSTINGSISGELDIIPTTLNIGAVSSKTSLNVYGSALLNDDVIFNGSIMIGNKLKITSKSNGVDIDFVE